MWLPKRRRHKNRSHTLPLLWRNADKKKDICPQNAVTDIMKEINELRNKQVNQETVMVFLNKFPAKPAGLFVSNKNTTPTTSSTWLHGVFTRTRKPRELCHRKHYRRQSAPRRLSRAHEQTLCNWLHRLVKRLLCLPRAVRDPIPNNPVSRPAIGKAGRPIVSSRA